MADKEGTITEVVLKVQRGEELTPKEEKLVMEAPDDVTSESGDETPAPDAKVAKATPPPEKVGKEKGEPEAESDDKSDEKEGDQDAEDTPSDEKEATPEAKKSDEEEAKAKIEKELEKPYGEEDLTDYSPRERALFFEMRRERRKRQATQEELDVMKFKRLQEQTAKEKEEKDPKKDAEKDPLDGRDEDEFLTVGDVKNLLAKQAPKTGSENEKKAFELNRQLVMRNWMLEGQVKHDDFLEVVDMAPDILEGDKDATEEIMETAKRGGNAALATYNLVISSPKFKGVKPKGEAKEERDVNQERADRIKNNEKKPRTTGGSGSGSVPASEYTYEDLVNMPEEEFQKMKPEKRQRLLKKLEGL